MNRYFKHEKKPSDSNRFNTHKSLNFVLSRAEHEKKFITTEPGGSVLVVWVLFI